MVSAAAHQTEPRRVTRTDLRASIVNMARTVRGVGFRAECRCGWKGSIWVSFSDALAEGRWHEYTETL